MPEPRERENVSVRAEKTVLAAVRLPEDDYDHEDPFGELRELVRQAGADPVGELTQNRDRPEAGTYMGRGKLDELRGLCEIADATTVVFDHELSPKQIANIEAAVERKVLDRSELILDIFASRATTHEARLQVELAQLEYTYPRLRAMWSHLERIVGAGGIGGVGTRGPGEQQLEIDRRLVQRRKLALERELAEIQGRKRRSVRARNAEHFTIGLVGYTNAGKSTLFNTLTAGGAYADDRLFATLMTRTRSWDLGRGAEVLLSDTVGFVRALPHHLVASFRATLEEATHADLLLVVLDVSDPNAEAHYRTVERTLDEVFEETERAERRLGIEADDGPKRRAWGGGNDGDGASRRGRPPRLVILNKADRLRDNSALLVWKQRIPDAVALCSLPDGAGRPSMGADELEAAVRLAYAGPIEELSVSVPMTEGKAVQHLETRAEVLERAYEGDTAVYTVRMGRLDAERLAAATRGAAIRPTSPA
ncbi:MAG: GTPase HflX [Planctomycetota bacterium]